MGHPINESYDNTDNNQSLHFNSATTDGGGIKEGSTDEPTVHDTDLSMEVEKDATKSSNHEVLLEESRIDNDVSMSSVVRDTGTFHESIIAPLDDIKEEEGGNESHPDNWGELGDDEEEDVNDIDNHQGPTFHPSLDDDQSSTDTYDPHQQEAATTNNNEAHSSATVESNAQVPSHWGSLDDNNSSSDDSEDDTDDVHKSDYVSKMRQSIESYFSSHSGSAPAESNEMDDSNNNGNDDSYGSLLPSPEKEEQSRLDISHKYKESALYSQGKTELKDDETEQMVNLSALGDDACQIDVDATLDAAGVQSVQYQRYENVLGELKRNGIRKAQTNYENRCSLVDECANGAKDDKPKPVVKSKYFQESYDLESATDVKQQPIEDCNAMSVYNVKSKKYFPESYDLESTNEANQQTYFLESYDLGPTFQEEKQPVEDFTSSSSTNNILDNNASPSNESQSITKTSYSMANYDTKQAATSLCDSVLSSIIDATVDDTNSRKHDGSQQLDSSLKSTCDEAQNSSIEKEVMALANERSIDTRRWSKESAPPPCSNQNEAPLLGSLSPISKSTSPHNSCELGSDTNAGNKNETHLDTCESVENITGISNEMKMATESISNELSASSSSSSKSDTLAKKASIFQVLSQPILNNHSKEEEPGEADLYNQSLGVDHPVMSGESTDSPDRREQSIVLQQEHDIDVSGLLSPQEKVEDKRRSLEDLSAYQQNFNSTSNAFLESLRGAAENRKREVSRVRDSMERKEQILYEEKKDRVERMPLSAVDENDTTEPGGEDSYNQFKTRSLQTPTTEQCVRPHKSFPSHASKSAVPTSRRKSLAQGDNPYIQFKARPMPGTSSSRFSTSHGSKRKSSKAFNPHPSQNKSHVKSSALNSKPPKRLLSGEDASIAKEMNQRKEEEEARIRRESTFKARPLPASTLPRNGSLAGEDLSSKAVQSVKENSSNPFIPRSSLRAQERASYDAGKAEREKQRRQEQIEGRNEVIAQTKMEIKELKERIR